jgi:hypothetical protein
MTEMFLLRYIPRITVCSKIIRKIERYFYTSSPIKLFFLCRFALNSCNLLRIILPYFSPQKPKKYFDKYRFLFNSC